MDSDYSIRSLDAAIELSVSCLKSYVIEFED